MALYKYFKSDKDTLPDPHGPLASTVPSATIQAANKAVKRVLDAESKDEAPRSGQVGSRGQYEVFSPTEKAVIAKYAIEVGVTKAIRKLEKNYPGRQLKESTVRSWVKKYKEEIWQTHTSPAKLDDKKRGKPLLLGKELDEQVKAYILALRDKGGVINSAIVQASAIGIVMKSDMRLLKCNGGHIDITKHWAQSFLDRLGFVKRRASSKAKVTVEKFEEMKAQFLFDVKTIVEMADVPPELVINWDHTGLNYVPVSNWTMAAEGSKRVEIAGVDDKRQITAVFAGTMNGFFLPPQIIYKGKTQKCLPSVSFPDTWHITYTCNHWANEKTTEDYILKILLPYVKNKQKELCVSSAIVIFDRFKGQCTPRILSLLASNNIYIAIVPGNCTDRLQPLDVSVNKSVKEYLRGKFQAWYSEQIRSLLNSGASDVAVDLKMSIMKPLGAKWLMEMYDHLLTKPEIIINGFKGSGILAYN